MLTPVDRLLGEVARLACEMVEPPPRGLDLLQATLLLRAVALKQVERRERGAEDDDEQGAHEQLLDEREAGLVVAQAIHGAVPQVSGPSGSDSLNFSSTAVTQ